MSAKSAILSETQCVKLNILISFIIYHWCLSSKRILLITAENELRLEVLYLGDGLVLSRLASYLVFNSSPPEQNGRRFTDSIFRCIFVNEKFCISIKISLKFVTKGPIDNNPALV